MVQGIKVRIKRYENSFNNAKVFAKAIGISRECLSALENGRTANPTKEVMEKIASALDTSIQELFFDE